MKTGQGKLWRDVAVEAEEPPALTSEHVRWVVLSAALLALLLWAYWHVVEPLWEQWQDDKNYSVGQLVPLAALGLIWWRRRRLRGCRRGPCWWGLGLLVASQAMRLVGMLDVRESIERYSLVVAVWGLVLLLAGARVFGRLVWVMLFLLLMVPLPGALHNRISNPLQSQAVKGTVVLLELSGVSFSRAEGNAIQLTDAIQVNVVEACSGLRMLTAFVVVSAVLAFLVDRPRWQKGLLLASSVPVGIACNLIRLFSTALLYLWADRQTAETFFHDGAGLVMMPIAVGLLMGELWVFNRLVSPEPSARRHAARRPRRPEADKQPVG